MKIFVAGLSYKTAPVELREKLAVHASSLRCTGCRLKVAGNLSEVVLVSTCNRVEVYGVARKVNGNVHNIFQHLSASENSSLSSHLYVKEGSEAVRHLYSVASGLDSMVLGNRNHRPDQAGVSSRAGSEADRSRIEPRFSNGSANCKGNPDTNKHWTWRHFRRQCRGGTGGTDLQKSFRQDCNDRRRRQNGRSVCAAFEQKGSAFGTGVESVLRARANSRCRIRRTCHSLRRLPQSHGSRGHRCQFHRFADHDSASGRNCPGHDNTTKPAAGAD